eukprot:15460166-Alexandrium_andersonii.AAC.1
MKRGFGAWIGTDGVIERRAKCFNELWALKMGAWDKLCVPGGEGDAVLEFWGFKVPRGEGEAPELRPAPMPPPFQPAIHQIEFCGYPTDAIDGNVPIGDACEGRFGPRSRSFMLQAVEQTGGGVNGNLYQRPSDSPHPELELWREVVGLGSAQAI